MAKKLWGGRFGKKTDPLVEEFTKSIDYDYKLAGYDILGSMIHVNVLEKSALLTSREARALSKALGKLYIQIKKGKFKFDNACEDVHTNIQNTLEERVGDVALKLHTARSRNEQIVFDLKVFCKVELSESGALCKNLQLSLAKACSSNKGVIIPGFTHLQHAQLVYLSDYLGSYIEMLKRDSDRLAKINGNITLGMGAGALAGTPINSRLYSQEIKRFLKKGYVKSLNIKDVTSVRCAPDAVSNRDFVIEIASALSILGMHLSRLAEDLIIWSTKEFGFVEIDDAFATGSSLMPQKKNPDVLELIRGYTGTLYGNLLSILTMMKGLPLGYNRDMQLDKEPLFSSFDIVKSELKVLARLVETLKWNKKLIEKRINEDETLYATDLVYYLIKKGIPFKKAHGIIGKLVKFCLDNRKSIKEIKDTGLARFSKELKHNEIIRLMNPVVSVKSRISLKRKR